MRNNFSIKNKKDKRCRPRARLGKCLVCGKQFRAINDYIHSKTGYRRKQKYCGKECWTKRNPPEIKKCLYCRKNFKTYERKTKKYCSIECRNKAYKKYLGEKSSRWKGDKVSYSGLHKWVNRYLGKAKKCIKCGKEGKRKEIQWANKSGKYLRSLSDWINLCAKCHSEYDKKFRRFTGKQGQKLSS